MFLQWGNTQIEEKESVGGASGFIQYTVLAFSAKCILGIDVFYMFIL